MPELYGAEPPDAFQSAIVPRAGYGTFGRRGEAGIEAIRIAIETGYRNLDTAQAYETEWEVGEAIRRSAVPREAVFITTKIALENSTADQLLPSLERSLETLGVDYVDLTLIHWPRGPDYVVDKKSVLPKLEEARAKSLTRTIGGSNFTIADLDESELVLGRGKLSNNQIECHPYLQNRKLVEACRQRGIEVTCFLPIARGTLAGDPLLETIARDRGATVEQIAIAFAVARGLSAIPTSSQSQRIRSNFLGFGIELSAAEVAAIETLDRGTRFVDPDFGSLWD